MRQTGQTKELVLEADIYELDGRRDIVGLPAIMEDRVWMVPRYDESLLFIDHNISFL